jgi:lipopolysaccharide export system protein LptC
METEKRIIVVILLLILALVIGWIIALSASHNEDEKAWLRFRSR